MADFSSVPKIANTPKDVAALRENQNILLGNVGSGQKRAVLIEDLTSSRGAGYSYNPRTRELTPPGTVNPQTPPIPQNVAASGAFTHIIISWDTPNFLGYSYAEIHRSASDDFGTAIRIGTTIAPLYADTVGYAASYYYWVRFVNTDNTAGPIHATNGELASTAPNVSAVMTALSDELNETHLAITLRSRIDLIDAPITGLVDQIAIVDADIVALELAVAALESGEGGSAAAIAALDARVTTNESTLTSVATSLTSLQAQIDSANDDITANSSAITTLQSSVTSINGSITAISSDITTLETGLDAANDDITTNGTAISGLQSSVTSINGSITTINTSLTSLQSQITSNDSELAANSSAITSITSSITSINGSITSLSASVTSLQSQIDGVDADASANASAISSLSATVTSINGVVTAQATDITQLFTDVGDNTSAITVITSSTAGIIAQWTVQTDVSGLVGGVGFYNDGVDTYFMVNAGTFAVLAPDDSYINPFFVSGGITYIDTALIAAASIQIAQIEELTVDDITGFSSAFVLSTIGTGNITNAYIGNIIQSNNYNPATPIGWQLRKSGDADIHNLYAENAYIRGDIEATSIQVGSANIIDTLMLQGQSVTIMESFFSASITNITVAGGFATIATRTIAITNAVATTAIDIKMATKAIMTLEGYDSSGAGNGIYTMRLLRNGAEIFSRVIFSRNNDFDISTDSAQTTLFYVDQPGTGSHTYALQVRVSGSQIRAAGPNRADGAYLTLFAGKR